MEPYTQLRKLFLKLFSSIAYAVVLCIVCSNLSSANSENYKFIRTLGKGAYAHVFLYEEDQNKEKIAAKWCHNLRSWEWRYMLREAFFLTMLDHAHVLKGLDIQHMDINKEEIVFVTPFYDQSLYQIIVDDQVKLNVNQRRKILFQILSGLCYLHSNKIIHRDVTSSNIFVRDVGNIDNLFAVLGDLGAAKMMVSHSFDGQEKLQRQSRDTTQPFYRPPESKPQRIISKNHDSWSIGVVMAQMLSSSVDMYWQVNWDFLENLDEEEKLVGFARLYPNGTGKEISLLTKLLHPVDKERMSACSALEHPFFEPLSKTDGEVIGKTLSFPEIKKMTDIEKQFDKLGKENFFEFLFWLKSILASDHSMES